MPALDRYTGVLYDALSPATLGPAARARAEREVVVASALFGAVRGGDPLPAYRLSRARACPGSAASPRCGAPGSPPPWTRSWPRSRARSSTFGPPPTPPSGARPAGSPHGC